MLRDPAVRRVADITTTRALIADGMTAEPSRLAGEFRDHRAHGVGQFHHSHVLAAIMAGMLLGAILRSYGGSNQCRQSGAVARLKAFAGCGDHLISRDRAPIDREAGLTP